MRERVKDKARLEHILGAIDVLIDGKSRYAYSEAVADPILFYGFVKHVEIIGEAVYMLSLEFKFKNFVIKKLLQNYYLFLFHKFRCCFY